MSRIRVSTLLVWFFGAMLAISVSKPILDWLKTLAVGGQTLLLVGLIFALIAFVRGAWAARKDTPKTTKRFFYVIFSGMIAGAAVYGVFGQQVFVDPFMQNAFDLRTAEPRYMGYQDREGNWKRGVGPGGNVLRPSDCRPTVALHAGFDYAKQGTCFAPATGARMVPMTPEQIPVVSLPELNFFGGDKTGASASEAKCPERIELYYLKPGGDREICVLKPNRTYDLYLSKDLVNRTGIRFDDSPFRVKRDFDHFPSDLTDLVEIARFNDGSEMGNSITTNSIRIYTKPAGYRRYLLDGIPVYLEVYIQ